MAGREAIRTQIAREADQVGELHALVAQRAGHRSSPLRIFVRESIDHLVTEPAFVIEDIMSDAEPVAYRLGIIDVLARAAAPRPLHRFAMIVELKRDADYLGAGLRGQRGHDAAVDAARHGDDDTGPSTARLRRSLRTGIGCGPAKLKIYCHFGCEIRRVFTRNSPCPARAGFPLRGVGDVNWRNSTAILRPRGRRSSTLMSFFRPSPVRPERAIGKGRRQSPVSSPLARGGGMPKAA